MTSNEEIEGLPGNPLFGFGISELLPGERTGRFRLAHPVHSQCIVHHGAAEQVTFQTIADVFECSRIYEHGMPLRLQANAQRIGMSMAPAPATLPTGIDRQLTRRIRSSEQVETSGR